MLVKLEGLQGQALLTLDVEMAAAAPDVLLFGRRVFKFVRTDGVWDRKSHVYREATALKAGRQAIRKLAPRQTQAGAPAAGPSRL